MHQQYQFREAEPRDNDRLIALAKRCAIKGQLHLYLDRFPDFFAMPKLQGEQCFINVVESTDSEIVACSAMIERTERWDGEDVKVLHFGDLRTDPEVRGTRIAGRLIQMYRDKLLNGGYHHGIAEIIDGNIAPVKAQKLLGDEIDVRHEGEVVLYQLLPLWNYRASKKWVYRTAENRDLPAIAALLSQNYSSVPGAPNFTSEWLENATQQHGSFGISQLWVAEDHAGQLSACIGVWDQSAVRRTVAERFSKSIKYIIRGMAVMGLLWRLPPIPREGQALNFSYLRWPAANNDIAALRALIRHVMREVRADGRQQFISIGFHKEDRLRHALKGVVKLKEHMHIYSHRVKAVQKNLPATQAQHRHYFDLALV